MTHTVLCRYRWGVTEALLESDDRLALKEKGQTWREKEAGYD